MGSISKDTLSAVSIYIKEGILPELDLRRIDGHDLNIIADIGFCRDTGLNFDDFVSTTNVGYRPITSDQAEKILRKYTKEV